MAPPVSNRNPPNAKAPLKAENPKVPLPELAPDMVILKSVTKAVESWMFKPGFMMVERSRVIVPVAVAVFPNDAPDQARS